MKISFPKHLIEPITSFLKKEDKQLEERKKKLAKEDPFSDITRTVRNAAIDGEAAEQTGHARVEALRKEIERRQIGIHKALTRIKIGKYGICEECGQMIDTDRLMVKPEAILCISCEKKREK